VIGSGTNTRKCVQNIVWKNCVTSLASGEPLHSALRRARTHTGSLRPPKSGSIWFTTPTPPSPTAWLVSQGRVGSIGVPDRLGPLLRVEICIPRPLLNAESRAIGNHAYISIWYFIGILFIYLIDFIHSKYCRAGAGGEHFFSAAGAELLLIFIEKGLFDEYLCI
jgi:hypothetical protein